MKHKVFYHNKPHLYKISGIRVIPMGKGIWYVYASFNRRGLDIICSGTSSYKNKPLAQSQFFGTDEDIYTELCLVPESDQERIRVWVGAVYKDYYEALVVSEKKWESGFNKWESSLIKKQNLP